MTQVAKILNHKQNLMSARSPRKHSEKPWFDEQCNIEKENLKSLGRHISRNPNVEELRSNLHKKKKAFKHLCRKKKRQHYNRIIKCIDLSNGKTAWRQLRKLFNLGKSKNMQKNTSEDLEKFYSYFEKLNARKQQNEEYILTRSEALGPLDYEISEQETVTAIDLLKTEKAPGVDNIVLNDRLW